MHQILNLAATNNYQWLAPAEMAKNATCNCQIKWTITKAITIYEEINKL